MATIDQRHDSHQPARGRYNTLIVLAVILVVGLIVYIVSAAGRRDETDIDRSVGTATIGSPPATNRASPDDRNAPGN
jgi:hypothetical protein